MSHARHAIRAAAIAALTGLPSTGSRVYDSDAYPFEPTELPALLVSTPEEDTEVASLGQSRLRARTLDLVVEGYLKAVANYQLAADTIAAEVESALDANQTLGGAKSVDISRTETSVDMSADKPVVRVRMAFKVVYYTVLGAPGAAI